MICMNIDDLFLLTLMFPGVVDVACVGFVLPFIGVVKPESLPRFTNVRRRGGLHGPKDCEKSSKLIVLSGFMPWLN